MNNSNSQTSGITVTDLHAGYTGHKVLNGISLDIPAGEVVSLVGASGSGKSTLLRCMVRLVTPESGTVKIGDLEISSANRKQLRGARKDIGVVFQKFNLVPRLSAFRNVLSGAVGRQGMRCLWPAVAPEHARDEAMECLKRVGMAGFADRPAANLSGGQQQRVAIARMLMQRPKIIMADEPVASLDPATGVGVMELLASLAQDSGLTMVMVLHHLDHALNYSDRVIGLRGGQIVIDGKSAVTAEADLQVLYGGLSS